MITYDTPWSEKAYAALQFYIQRPGVRLFLCEDVRNWADKELRIGKPTSNHAWGPIIQKAMRAGLIHRRGAAQVRNKRAHKAYVSILEVAHV